MVRLKSNTGRKGNPPNSVGKRLRKARESKSISIEEAHRATKILTNVLEALEEDRLEHTLGATYVKAFLRTYAGYLGLDVKEIIREYSLSVNPKVYDKPVLQPRPVLLSKDKGLNHAMVAVIVVVTWLIILSFTTAKFISSYKSFVKGRKAAVPEKVVLEPRQEPARKAGRGLIPIPTRRTISLTVTTDRDVWLKVIQDGEVAFRKTLPKNSKETWQANKELVLAEIGKPEALKLNVNGKDIDFSGRRLGRSILITHKGIDIGPGQKD